ncbi:MAG: hypothetical protein JNK63_02875 [Chthonomonas sp.]|nr:hypothetical protein [Chthonomonas sp.]
MKQLLAMALVCAVAPAMAVKFGDVSGDCNAPMTTYGNPNVDLLGLEIFTDLDPANGNAPRLNLIFTTAGPDIQSPGWIKCVMAIRGPDQGFGVNTGPSTGWPRLFNIAGGSNRWIGGWCDGAFGGFEARTWNGTDFGLGSPAGATWLGTPGMISTMSGNTATYQVLLSTLGLQLGDSIHFEATTTGGDDDDGAWDPISMFQNQITAPDQQITTSGNLAYACLLNVPNQTISGNLQLNDVVMNNSREIRYAVMLGTSAITTGSILATSANAGFSIDVPDYGAVSASIVFDGSSFLQKTVPVSLTGANQAIGAVAMQNGDVDTSGEVDAADIDQVIANFGDVWPGGVGNPNSDADASGEVDAADIDIVIANFGNIDG